TAPLENSLGRWGLMDEKQQISLEKFLGNQAYIRNL
ncbi:SMI1/KNR4 family protein, partial [Phocaeicola vulgatus]